MFGGARAPAILALLIAATLMGSAAPMPARAASPRIGAPRVEFNEPASVRDGKLSLLVTWDAAIDAGAPISQYRVQRSVDSGAWISVDLPSRLARSVVVLVKPWRVVQFRVRAIDSAGNRSTWAKSQRIWVAAPQESTEAVKLSDH